jgi:arylsulfatase A-like enzyme
MRDARSPTAARTSRAVTATCAILAAGLLAYTSFRAATLSFTHDESFSYLHYVTAPIAQIFSFEPPTANNHPLNSVLMKLAAAVLGPSELALRLPNLLGHVIYLIASFLLIRPLRSNTLRLTGFVLLNLNPYLLDFFGLARGYGLAAAMMLASLHLFVSILDSDDLPTLRPTAACFSLAGLAALANLALLNYLSALIFVFSLVVVARALRSSERGLSRWRSLAVGLGPGILVCAGIALLLGPATLKLLGGGHFYFGGETGFWSDTARTLVSRSLYLAEPSHDSEATVSAVTGAVGVAVLLCAVAFSYQLLRRSNSSSTRQALVSTALLLVLALAALANVVEHGLLGLRFITGRTALFLVPLFFLVLIHLLHHLWRGRLRKLSLALCLAIVAAAGLNAAGALNLTHSLDWKYDAHTGQMLSILADEMVEHDLDQVRISTSWQFEPTMEFYRRTRQLHWLIRIPLQRRRRDPPADYLYLSRVDYPHREKQLGEHQIVWQPPSGSAVLVRPQRRPQAPRAPGTKRPHVIIMSIDTLRADHLGVYGYELGTSPNLDAFAKRAVLFDHAVSSSHNTAPAHMSIFTGLAPSVHRIVNCTVGCKMTQRLEPQIATLAELLKKQGYATAGFHGGANLSDRLGFDQGFDLYTSEIKWRAVYERPSTIDPIRRWIRARKDEEKPQFLFLHHYICHDPYLQAPERFRQRYLRGKRVAGLPTSLSGIITTEGFPRIRREFWRDIRLDDPKHRQHVLALYDGAVRYADHLFGEISKLLETEGIYDDSVLIVLSDHGEEFYEHQGNLHKKLFVEVLHVPLLIKLPHDRHAGRRVSRRVGTIDLMPTLLDLLGVRHELELQGRSFMPLLAGSGQEYRPFIVSYSSALRAVRFQQGGWTYSSQKADLDGETVTDWLFKRTDPLERHNLAAANPDVVRRMRREATRILERDAQFRKRLLRAPSRQHPVARPPSTAKERLERQLRSLGYID